MRARGDKVARDLIYSVSQFLNSHEDLPQRTVMREELDLAGAIEKNIIFFKNPPHPATRQPFESSK